MADLMPLKYIKQARGNYYISSFGIGFLTRIFDAVVKFISIPLLIKYLGIENYGILTLAISVNAYMALFDLGIKTGNIKLFSEWISQADNKMVDIVGRTCMSFFGIVGLVNAAILVTIALWGQSLFKLSSEQFRVFQQCLFILAGFSIVDWYTSVFGQILIAAEKTVFVKKVEFIKILLYLAILYCTIYLGFSLQLYFLLQLIISSLVSLPYYLKVRKSGFITSVWPANDWRKFNKVFSYSIAIFAMGVFQLSASQARPIVLGALSSKGVEVLAEYRIIQVFPTFIMSIAGLLISIILPRATRLMLNNNPEAIESYATKGTRLVTILMACMVFPVILSSKEILQLYVGSQHLGLSPWLALWSFNVLIAGHNAPIASMVLASGKTKALVFSSLISFIVSLLTNIYFVNRFQVGSAVLSYSTYLTVQMGFYYFYFNQQVLKIKSLLVFNSFIKPVILGLIIAIVIHYVKFNIDLPLVRILINTACWGALFITFLLVFRLISLKESKALISKK